MVALIAMAGGCQASETGDASRTPPPGPALTPAELRNASYYLGLEDDPVTLSAGEWHGEPFVEGGASRPRASLVDDFTLTGDLNADGVDETVVLLWTNSGGSGTFDYIAVMNRDSAGTPVNLATAALGDRVGIRAARIVNGRVIVDAIQAGPDDAACCPGQKIRRSFTLEDGAIIEQEAEDLGRQSIVDLAGVEWVLERFNRNEEVPDEIEITLVFDGERFSGGSGCNRYSGSVVEGEIPGALTIDTPMASTMMACAPPADEIERRYLGLLQGIQQYSFIAGKLALSWRIDDPRNTQFGTMLFTEKG
jgi:heat shock protein HslJ